MSQRWEALRKILAEALQREPKFRSTYLDESCPDPSMRRDADSLLPYAQSILFEPTSPRPSPESELELVELEGKSLAHYRILHEISRGGMGIVYRARDRKLDRDVALKVLPPHLVEDPERRERFVREARAAAGLRHPRIAVVHDIDDSSGLTFITMELIEGMKLRELVARERLPPRRAVSIALDVAAGLAHAHDKGIVHRDVKSSNVLIDEEGHAKLIDFGLAKLLEPTTDVVPPRARIKAPITSGVSSSSHLQTSTGLLVGTVAYMSPEQARGETVDHRSDIFSLGVVLYEMLTQQLPFVAPSLAETVYRVIDEPAPPLAQSVTGRHVGHLQRVVDRCLAKDPGKRYSSAEALAVDLRRLEKRLAVTTSTRILRASVAAASVIVVAWLGLSVLFQPPSAPDVPRFARPVRLTSTLGTEDFPVWSPDGEHVAFQSNQSGNWDIWVSALNGGEPMNLTADHTGDDRFPTWSPDGRRIAFWSDREKEGYFVMPASGGTPRKVVRAAAEGPAHWSRGGDALTFVDSTTYEVFLTTVSLEGEERRRILAPGKSVGRQNPSWSPDERLVAYLDAGAYNSAVHPLLLLRVEDGAHFSITDGTTRIWTASWSADGRRLYFTSDRGGSSDLWEQAIGQDGTPEGEPRRVTTGLGVRSAVFSPDGRKVAYSQGQRSANLWKVPIREDRPATWEDARQLTYDEALIAFVSVSPDRTSVLFSSNRRGSQDLWSAPVDGGEPRRITDHTGQEFAPVSSPDGQRIAFYSDRGGNRDLWIVSATDGTELQVTKDEAQDFHPDWSPDGRWLAFMSMRAGSRDIWAIPAEGGDARQLTSGEEFDHFPNWSPDGTWLVFLSRRDGDLRLWRVDFAGGEPQPVTRGPAQYPRWSIDGKRIYFTGMNERTNNIWAIDIATGAEFPMTDFTGRPGTLTATGLATDGESLFFSWDEDPGDVWVVEVENPR